MAKAPSELEINAKVTLATQDWQLNVSPKGQPRKEIPLSKLPPKELREVKAALAMFSIASKITVSGTPPQQVLQVDEHEARLRLNYEIEQGQRLIDLKLAEEFPLNHWQIVKDTEVEDTQRWAAISLESEERAKLLQRYLAHAQYDYQRIPSEFRESEGRWELFVNRGREVEGQTNLVNQLDYLDERMTHGERLKASRAKSRAPDTHGHA